MFNNYRRFTGLILFLVITVFTSPVLARRPVRVPVFEKRVVTSPVPEKPVDTVENIPQNLHNQIVENIPVTASEESIEEIKKVNTSLKKDINILGQQVNNLSNDINGIKTSKAVSNNLQQMILDNWEAVLALLSFILLFIILLALISYSLLKSSNKKSIQTNLEGMINNTKNEILTEFKINETDFHTYTTQSSAQKLENFNANLENKYDEFNNKFQESINTELTDFKENVEHLIKRRLDKFSFELENQFEEGKTQLLDELETKLPQGDLNAVILKLAEEKGLFNNLTAQIEHNLSEILANEMEKLEKHLANKELSIISDIQKVHLANNHFNIGNILVKNKNYSEAIDEFKEAIRIDPNFYGAYINLSKAFESEEQFNEAIETYKKAIEVRPEHYKSYFNLGNLLNRLEMYESAIDAYKMAIEYRPDYPKLYNNIGTTYQMLNMFEEAKENYTTAITLNNEYADAYLNLSKVEAQLEKNEDIFSIAEKYLKKHNASKKTYSTVKELVVLQK